MSDTWYTPQSIAPILANGAAQQIPLLRQPTGLSGALPGIGEAVDQGFKTAADVQNNKSLIAARQQYADYLSKVDSGTATPEDHKNGYMAALSLGINPPVPKPGANVTDPSIVSALSKKAGLDGSVSGNKENVAGLEKLAQLNRQNGGASQQNNLTPKEQAAIVKATQRGQNPLSLDWLAARGPKAKVLAQSLIQNPNYDPTTASASSKSTIAGAEAGARLNMGGDAQKSARAAQTVISLTDGLQKASDAFSRSNTRLLNVPINAMNEQSGTAAMGFKQYLVDTRSKMATALQGGGVPTNEANEAIAKNFPDTMTPAQIPAAIKNIKDIMRTQISGALTPVTAAQGQQPSAPQQIGRFQVSVSP